MSATRLCQSFPFVASPEAEVLILGSMPGRRSLEQQEYYAHPHNLFWDLMGATFGAGRLLAYQARLQVLKKNRVALWDVAFQCRRNGSLDSDIRTKTVMPNDFKKFFAEHPRVRAVFFNGHKAEQLFMKLVLQGLGVVSQNLKFVRLPSTSPAHAALTRGQKKLRWRQCLRGALSRYFVYILESADGKYYTGYTTDLTRRMAEHCSGKGSKFVRAFGFKRLLYQETYQTKVQAMKREAELKRWSRAQKQALIRRKKTAKTGSLQVQASM